ncbi:hypothetical protein O3G_MSEX010669 [Manduca sexta]|uniref:NADP-dependent oxidoreductase domain-containing protein n=1 Tax=Manduca sexta TaxID=7130 RepID=A0A921ZJB7_MANSE|nr:hypothetical protein O3G_MSEX010669 [Manduca sexta]
MWCRRKPVQCGTVHCTDNMILYTVVIGVLLRDVSCDAMDGGKPPRIPLNDGNSIPAMGLGTFLGFDQRGPLTPQSNEVELAVKWGLDAGYRLLDTAALYNDEDQVGAAVRSSGVPRENIFLVTKLGANEQRNVLQSLQKSLERLNLSYVDLYLIHTPISFKPDFSGYDDVDYVDTWKEMEKAKNMGLAKSIGISNFNISQIDRLLANCQIKPSVLQVEVNLNLGQDKLIEHCKKNDIVVMAYTPFGSLFDGDSPAPPPRANHPTLMQIAEKYGKTTPQVALRYLMQRGLVPIPKSLKKSRIEQNIDLFNFELTAEEMAELAKFNKNFRKVSMEFWQDHPYFPFEKKDNPLPDPFGFNKGKNTKQ